jgi:hypothetical protein
MYRRYDNLSYLYKYLIEKGYGKQELSFFTGQIMALEEFIKKETFFCLGELLKKTNFRLLKSIEKGSENLVNIIENPSMWYLGYIKDNAEEWLSPEALVFSTERQQLVFSKNVMEFKYINNKWQ